MKPILTLSNAHHLHERAAAFAKTASDAAESADTAGAIDAATWGAFHRSGLAMAAFPEALGGAGLSEGSRQSDLCMILRLVGAADLCFARLFEGHINAIALVCRYGTRAQMLSLADSVAEGALSAVWGADDAAGLAIKQQGDRSVLRGRKILASGAGLVTRPIVTAASPAGQMMCLLDLARHDNVDLSGWTPLGMRSTMTGAVELSGIGVGPDEIVGVAGDFMRQPHFSGGAWRFCAAQLGAMERLVELFREHLVARRRADDPYQLQRVAHCVASANTARFWVEEAARRLGASDHDAASTVAFANMTRMVTERCALEIMQEVQRGVGLVSFIRPNPIERISRDLSTYLRQPAPDLAMGDAARAWLASTDPVGEF
ncbi:MULTISPECIES: acyl-CoA dehydrogenase family protein [Rhodopseudomonas]|uniref:Acyl-CoA dehydrogenase n=1 Tax=Rhodopseudomonas palustris TaxID=1076 RepID=A0A0D7F5I4_RHOPL|nr:MULTISPECIES: acyl-CoA dehydrogenase family protein [Rhodopseudomonas]KIZ48036.1 acyl-CoA dehydrogenase [Rhodopseudomonas palustris]MDF3810265.1 acyl-CoA dehydrogenase family protein [Rhodopseudomonas sp. BAL398]WOK16048.1 acyl-CoA dehydrogenase family protein [Rhodopseudomonas sp. BAL398]